VRGLARELIAGAREGGMSRERLVFFDTPQDAAAMIAGEARPGDLILVKGSRGVKTEAVVERLKQEFEAAETRSSP